MMKAPVWYWAIKNFLILGKRKTGFILGQRNLFNIGPKNTCLILKIGMKFLAVSSITPRWGKAGLSSIWISFCVFLYLYVCICAIIFMYLYLCFAVEHHSSVKKCAYAGLFSICFYKIFHSFQKISLSYYCQALLFRKYLAVVNLLCTNILRQFVGIHTREPKHVVLTIISILVKERSDVPEK